jgi:hypothetical protein
MFGGGYDPGRLHNSTQRVGSFMASTCRQRIDILPSKNQGGEMTLPFIWKANWLKIGVASDFSNMGEFVVTSTDVLYNANSTIGTDVTLQIFAWAEDVVVSAPTSELPLQTDEYRQTGKISSIATTVADTMDLAVGAIPPLLRPYALATSIGARGISAIASIFGFTNVPVIDDVTGFKNLPFHGIASSEISTPQEKLTLDPKNELTIDNRIAGGDGTDELAIQYLCSKKNVFSLRNWLSTDAPGDVICEINVTPNLSLGVDGIYTLNSIDPCYHPPMALVAKNFNYWRGTMVYRFKFICSQYHRGRIAILWDPVHGVAANFDYTTNYSRIVDLAEESEIIIKVPFMQPTSHLFLGFDPILANIPCGTATVAAFSENRHNGKLILKVLTNQTSPVASADVLVYVETSMEDADFAAPRDPQQVAYGSYLQIQTDEQQVTVKECNIADVEIKPPQNLHKVYMGEKISSMRALMRRRAFYTSLIGPNTSTTTAAVWTPFLSRKPVFAGYDLANTTTTAISTVAVGSFGYNYVNELVSNMFAPCFVGERGSYNYDFNYTTNAKSGADNLSFSRSYHTYPTYYEGSVAFTSSGTSQNKQSTILDSLSNIGKNGSALTNQKTQSGLSIQVPFYSRYRFTNTNPIHRRMGLPYDDSDFDNIIGTLNQPNIINDVTKNFVTNSFEVYCGIGTDFQLLYFVNVPSVWYYFNRPTP